MKDRVTIPISFLLAFALAFLVSGLWAPKRKQSTPPKPTPAEIRTQVQYVLDTSSLASYRAEIRRTVGDSLRRAFRDVASRRRPSIPRPADSIIVRDTVCLAGEDVRTILVEDSALVVSRDSARNVLAECEFDRDQLLDSLGDAPSANASRLRPFMLGAVVGGAAAAIGILWGIVAQ